MRLHQSPPVYFTNNLEVYNMASTPNCEQIVPRSQSTQREHMYLGAHTTQSIVQDFALSAPLWTPTDILNPGTLTAQYVIDHMHRLEARTVKVEKLKLQAHFPPSL